MDVSPACVGKKKSRVSLCSFNFHAKLLVPPFFFPKHIFDCYCALSFPGIQLLWPHPSPLPLLGATLAVLLLLLILLTLFPPHPFPPNSSVPLGFLDALPELTFFWKAMLGKVVSLNL